MSEIAIASQTEGLPATLRLLGDSMSPFISSNDELIVDFYSKPDGGQHKPGDLVIIRNGGEWAVHRLIQERGRLVTKGDHSLWSDEPTVIWGRVTGIKAKSEWGPRTPPMAGFFVLTSRFFRASNPRWVRWTARVSMFIGHALVTSAVYRRRLQRRSWQAYQILFGRSFKNIEAMVGNLRERYSDPSEVAFYKSVANDGLEEQELDALNAVFNELPQRQKLLVVGCGAGRETFALRPHFQSVVGLDISQKMVDAAKSSKSVRERGIEFVTGDIHDIRTTERFDLIFVARGVLNHVPGIDRRVRFLNALRMRMAPKGKIVIFPDVAELSWKNSYYWTSFLLRVRWDAWRPGDIARSFLGPHNKTSNMVYYHFYPSAICVRKELHNAGLKGKRLPLGGWIAEN